VEGLSKAFPGQLALDNVFLSVLPGEIHGLVGVNGSGKSTLVKVLAGFQAPDCGSISVDGTPLRTPYAPSTALRHGMCFVHQDLALVPTLSVMENLALTSGFSRGAAYRIRWREQRHSTRAVLRANGLSLRPDVLVSELSPLERTLLAIARALESLGSTGKVLLLDEASAGLGETDVRLLHERVREVASRGVGVLYISHRLREVLQVTDRITVLRDGRVITTRPTADVSEAALVAEMLGSIANRSLSRARSEPGATRLSIDDLSGGHLASTTFEAERGEIVGITSLEGSVRSSLVRLLTGELPPSGGRVTLDGKPLQLTRPFASIRHGVGVMPEDRQANGCFPLLTVRENATLSSLRPFKGNPWLSIRRERAAVRKTLFDFAVYPRDPEAEMCNLSGGNQQKVILARSMAAMPRLLILHEPTHGVDLPSKQEIYRIVGAAAASGTTVLLVTMETDDLMALADRVVVIDQKGVRAVLARDELDLKLVAALSPSVGA
jgi:ribose transport system ATP-binding protein